MHLWKCVPVPQYKTACGTGNGLAVCPPLGLLVTSDSDNNTLTVWSLPGLDDGGGNGDSAGEGGNSGLTCVCTLGGMGSPAPMQFSFSSGFGYLAFTPMLPGLAARDLRRSPHLLLVTDAGHDAVHIVDVVARAHIGYVAAPGSIAGPRGVAASKDLVAVSAWYMYDGGDHVVHLYRPGGSGLHWVQARVIGGGFGRADGLLNQPYSLRFSADGSMICVADVLNDRVGLVRVGDGCYVRHITMGRDSRPYDVEKVEGGWVVACAGSDTVEFVSDGGDSGVGRVFLGKAGGGYGSGHGEFFFSWRPGLCTRHGVGDPGVG